MVPKAPRNPDTPLQMGDVIAAVNGTRVRSYREFTALNTVECDTVSWLHFFLREQRWKRAGITGKGQRLRREDPSL